MLEGHSTETIYGALRGCDYGLVALNVAMALAVVRHIVLARVTI